MAETINHGCDLRRHRRRETIDRIIECATHLDPFERGVVLAVYVRHATAIELARELHLNPRLVRRHVRDIVARVLSAEFAFVQSQSQGWIGNRRRVAQACFLRGASMRRAASELQLSLHMVRRHHDAIRCLFDASQRAQRRAS